MTAPAPAKSPESRPARRGPVFGIAAVALAWVVALAVLVACSANPVVVNRAQIWHADTIVLGAWDARDPSRLNVERTWKTPLAADSIAVSKAPTSRLHERMIVPVTRLAQNQFEVTQGVLLNPLERRPVGAKPKEPRHAEVQPLMYPATEDVIRQIEALLSAAKPVE